MSNKLFYLLPLSLLILTITLTQFSVTVNAENITGLDAITNFTAFCTGSFDGYSSQCEGSIAAQSNVTISQYTVSSALPLDCERFDIIAGQNLTFYSASVNGNISYGGVANISQAGYPCGATNQPSPVNFTQYQINLINTTQTLALYPPNGIAILQNQRLTIQGNDPSTNVFFISQVTAQTMTEVYIDVPANSYAYINVGGQYTQIASLQMNLSNTTSLNQILFNFPQSQYLSIGNVAFLGSILAPYANLYFSEGDLQGGFVADNYTGIADLKYVPFLAPNCICPPCSGSIKLPDYSIYVLNNVSLSNAEDGGRLACGGNCTLLSQTIGSQLNNSNGARNDLIVNEDLYYYQGSVPNGNILVGGTANVTNVYYENLNYGPSLIDFVGSFASLEANSQFVSQLSPNGFVSVSFNEMKLEGFHLSLNIFYLTPSQIADITNLIVIAPKESWVVINIAGTNSTLSGMDMQIVDISKQRILWNFFETANLLLENINVLGSILAPQANTQITSGMISGSIICSNLSGSGSVTYNPWIPFTPPCRPCEC